MFARKDYTVVAMTDQEEQEIVRKNKGLVYYIAQSFVRCGHELDDIAQEGFIGLLSAARTYDHIQPWGVWAGCKIRWQILAYLRSLPPAEGSLDVEGDDGEESLLDCLADTRRASPELDALDKVELQEVLEAIPDARAREVFKSSVGGESLSSIAHRLGFTKQTSLNILRQTVKDLRARHRL
jgi:RNA polymerase sigma factor (sigma-70 family)